MVDLKDLDLKDITPSNLLADSTINALCEGITPELKGMVSNVDSVYIYSKIDTLPMDVIEHLAWQFHINTKREGWFFAKTDAEKRNLIKNAFILHMTKGTKAAILRVFGILNMPATVQEWFEYGGLPATFRINVNIAEEIENEKIESLGELVEEYKNERSNFEIDLNLSTKAGVYLGIASVDVETTTIYPASYTVISVEGSAYSAAITHEVNENTI